MLEKNIPQSLPDRGVFIGEVIKEPNIKNNNVQLIAKTELGKILITVANYPEYFYGDVVKITGKIQFPTIFDEFNYKNYLAKDKIYYVMYYPKIEILDRNQGNKIFSAILKFKNNLTQKVETLMPFPEVSILEGIILGNKQIFSEEIKNNLSITGTSHITAISGMNIVIISEILMIILIGLGLWRKQAFYFVVVLIFLFIVMVGAPASAVRAGIMGMILLYAKKVGRLGSATRIMVFAGAIMLLFNPFLLRYDVGFQLSFIAVIGLVYIIAIIFIGVISALITNEIPENNASKYTFFTLFISGSLIGFFLGQLAALIDTSRVCHFFIWFSVIFFNMGSVILEGKIFSPALVPISLATLLIQQLFISIIISFMILKLFAKNDKAARMNKKIIFGDAKSYLIKFLFVCFGYIMFYYIFGYINFQLVTKPYYQSHDFNLSIPSASTVIVFQFLRAPLIVLSVILFISSINIEKRKLIVVTGLMLFWIGGFVPLLMQILSLPLILVVASEVEIFFQNFLTGALAVILLHKNH